MILSQVTYVAVPQQFFTLWPTAETLQHVPCQFPPPAILPCQGSRDPGSALVAHHIPYVPLHLLSITHLTWEDLQSWSQPRLDLANCTTMELYREMESLVHQLPYTPRLPGTQSEIRLFPPWRGSPPSGCSLALRHLHACQISTRVRPTSKRCTTSNFLVPISLTLYLALQQHNWQDAAKFGTPASGRVGPRSLVRDAEAQWERGGASPGFLHLVEQGPQQPRQYRRWVQVVWNSQVAPSSCTDLCLCKGSGDPGNGAAALLGTCCWKYAEGTHGQKKRCNKSCILTYASVFHTKTLFQRGWKCM